MSLEPSQPIHGIGLAWCGCRTYLGSASEVVSVEKCAQHRPAPTPPLTLEQFNALRDHTNWLMTRGDAPKLGQALNVEKLENNILDIIAEFGDQPEQCLSIISELIDQRQHFRAHPNAPRVE